MVMVIVGVLALQGAFLEHITLLKRAAIYISEQHSDIDHRNGFEFIEIRTTDQLSRCDALIIPGGESTTISLVAAQSDLLESLRNFVKVERKPTWGTCAGLILLAEAANATKKGGQELIGGLNVRVNRNHFGRQTESFEAGLNLPFLREGGDTSSQDFPGVFIRAPVVEKILPSDAAKQLEVRTVQGTIIAPSSEVGDENAEFIVNQEVEVMGILPGRLMKATNNLGDIGTDDHNGDIVVVRQGNVFGTSFHPELTNDIRIHVWWLEQVLLASKQ